MAASVQPEEPDQEPSEPLKYKTWVLKVSIHCEGCKRKVKRILHSVEGVYTIDVDTKQHKVVITGNVEANTLLRKLEKSGKHAELWPNKYNYSHPDEQQQQQQQQQEQQQQQQNEDEQNQNVENNDQQQQQQQQQQQHPQNSCPPPQNMVREVRFEGNIPATGGNPNTPGNDASGGGGGGGGSGGAKKKKKKKKSNSSGNSASNNNSAVNNNNEVNNCGPPQTEPPPPQQPQQPPQQQQQQYMGPGPGSGSGQGMYPNPSPGVNRVYEYPPTHHAPPPPTLPACGMSYNTAYPRRYTSSYYSTQQPYSYAYVHQGGDVEMSVPLDLGAPSLQPSDTFEIFSDENPNACSVM